MLGRLPRGSPAALALGRQGPATLHRPDPRVKRRRWLFSASLLFVIIAAWGLATPMAAAPDEATQLVKAAAVARGELVGNPVRGKPEAVLSVQVPEVFAQMLRVPTCYIGRPDTPGSCAAAPEASTRTVSAITYVGRYPPLYYLVVGAPSLVFDSTFGMHMMRLLSALLSAAFLASALESALGADGSRSMVLGVAVAATPMAIWLSGTVNPNGLEITSAICLWASGAALVLGEGSAVEGRLVARAGISAAVLVQMRGLSVLWAALIVAALVACGRRERLEAILNDRSARAWGAVVAASTLFGVWWLVRYNPLAVLPLDVPRAGTALSRIAGTAFGNTWALVHEMVGLLGSADVPAPWVTFYGWLLLAAALVALGVRSLPARARSVLACLFVAVVAVPALIETEHASRVGFIWQGRYTLPLAVGIPILASARGIARSARAERRVSGAFAAVILVALIAIYYATLRRYAVGVSGSLVPLWGAWQPPFTAIGVTLVFLAASIVYSLSLYGLTTSGRRDRWRARSRAGRPLPVSLSRASSRPLDRTR